MAETHVKYVVEIKRVVRVETVKQENLVTKETPTDKVESQYGDRKTYAAIKEYQVVDVPKVEVTERSVYRQEVESLQVSDVIHAVIEASRDTIKAS